MTLSINALLNVVMLSVVMLNVVVLRVVAPSHRLIPASGLYSKSFRIVIYDRNNGTIVIYDCNDSSQYYKTIN